MLSAIDFLKFTQFSVNTTKLGINPMIDKLRSLKRHSMLTIDDAVCRQITTQDDFSVDDIECIQTENEQIVIVTMGDYYLIGTDVGGDEKFAVCEIYDEGNDYLDRDEINFLDEIDIGHRENATTYYFVSIPLDLGNDCAFCEYETNEDYYHYLLIHRNQESAIVYRGVTINEDDIII